MKISSVWRMCSNIFDKEKKTFSPAFLEALFGCELNTTIQIKCPRFYYVLGYSAIWILAHVVLILLDGLNSVTYFYGDALSGGDSLEGSVDLARSMFENLLRIGRSIKNVDVSNAFSLLACFFLLAQPCVQLCDEFYLFPYLKSWFLNFPWG